MTISYNWICEYIPQKTDPERISKILTSIGLEVESLERYESIRGGLEGLVAGEVREVLQHPGADKLKLTSVHVGNGIFLQIVCGAPNVATGQKVVVAPVGTTIYPLKGEPVTMKTAKIRGEESFGMICAEDEIGLGESHAGIIVLPDSLIPGTPLADHFKPYTDWIYEIGLTPNRMDAMSHLGVARDVCAYLSHHEKTDIRIKNVYNNNIKSATNDLLFSVTIENASACKRYSGISISNINIGPSPEWMQNKLRSIGHRPINNIVDITNYILHDTGQPLHAFDVDKINGRKIVIGNLPQDTVFKTLDGKDRKLSSEDLMICDGDGNGLCIAGVYGGADSGVNPSTTNIFLESAWFNPVDIRKTSFRHGLRTDAATRFEKNADISNTVNVLKRAAQLIIEICGGEIASDITDLYPSRADKTEVTLKHHYLKKLSGKNYHADAVKNILQSLGFVILKEGPDDLRVTVPFSKPDITLQADIVEEIMRIDGYDNIPIPAAITITPSAGANNPLHVRKEKTAAGLVGLGFNEIFTNSITNLAYFEKEETDTSVKLLNNLSAVHNVMRPSMLETGLESISYNLNRKNHNLRLFEFGKTYHTTGPGKYQEEDHLCLYITGNKTDASWKGKAIPADIYYLKGIIGSTLKLLGINDQSWETTSGLKLNGVLSVTSEKQLIVEAGVVKKQQLARFDIRQEVLFADIRWNAVQSIAATKNVHFTALPNQLPVHRDLAMVVSGSLPFHAVETAVKKIRLGKLRSIQLFDVFESEKLGADKKSFAVSFTFLDDEKTLTDKEIDVMMNKIMHTLEQDLSAEIRKGS